MAEFTPGRYWLSWVPAGGARNPIALTSQVKAMREGFERLEHKPALILCVVADGEEDEAVERIKAALNAGNGTARGQRISHGRHCTCSSCAQEDWTNADLAPCGMHGADCPALYQPWGPAGSVG